MEKNKITITTIPVTIKVMEVGGKKLTLSVFKQIPRSWSFSDETIDVIKINFLGWVKHDFDKYILFSENGTLLKLRKSDIPDRLNESLDPLFSNENQIYIAI